MKKRVIILSVVALLVLTVVSILVYQWPIHKERHYDNVALHQSELADGTTSGFVDGAATVSMSLTRRRKLTEPDIYSGTLTINGQEYTISSGRNYGSFIDAWKDKLAKDKQDYIYLQASIEKTEEREPGVFLPSTVSFATIRCSRDLETFYLMENTDYLTDFYAYVYPADNEKEAYAIVELLYS